MNALTVRTAELSSNPREEMPCKQTHLPRGSHVAPSPPPAGFLRAADTSSQSCEPVIPCPPCGGGRGEGSRGKQGKDHPRQRDANYLPTAGFECNAGERNPFCAVGALFGLAFCRERREGGNYGAGDCVLGFSHGDLVGVLGQVGGKCPAVGGGLGTQAPFFFLPRQITPQQHNPR